MDKGGQFWFWAVVSVLVHAALLLAPLPVSRNRDGADPYSIWDGTPIMVTWEWPAGEGRQGGTVPSPPPSAGSEMKKPPVTTVQVPVSAKSPVPVRGVPSPAVTASEVPPATAPGNAILGGSASAGGTPAAASSQSDAPAIPGHTPEPVYAPKPVYPLLARQQGWEGEVFLEAVVLPDGRVESVKILSSSGRPALDNAARKAVAQWIYQPLPPSDTKTRRLEVHLVFRLQGNP